MRAVEGSGRLLPTGGPPSGGGTPEPVARRLAGKAVLVTGATGLVGKALVEKLLRAVPTVGRVLLLVRAGGAREPAGSRAASAILGSSIFGPAGDARRARAEAAWREKVRVVTGDVTVPGLGLDRAGRRALGEGVDVVVNAAASVRFDERLDRALAVNVDGPLRLLDLARREGAALVHVSTSYVAGRRAGDVPEAILDVPNRDGVDPEEVLEQARWLGRIAGAGRPRASRGAALAAAGGALAEGWGWYDAYGLTKWLAERALDRAAAGVPLAIVRPSVVGSTLREPVPGWIGGLRGLDPLIAAYGMGRLTGLPADADAPLDVIPLDLVVNAIVLAAAEAGLTEEGAAVYQVGSSARNALRPRDLARIAFERFSSSPLADRDGRPIAVRPFRFTGAGSPVPAPPNPRRDGAAPRRARRTLRPRRGRSATVGALARYAGAGCRFLDAGLQRLVERVHPDDRIAFACDAAAVDWPAYLRIHVASVAEALERVPAQV